MRSMRKGDENIFRGSFGTTRGSNGKNMSASMNAGKMRIKEGPKEDPNQLFRENLFESFRQAFE